MTTPPHASLQPGQRRLTNTAGMAFTFLANGALGRIEAHGLMVNLFPGNAVEGGPANIWLRLHGEALRATPLLGPLSPLRLLNVEGYAAVGEWQGLHIRLELRLAETQAAWIWQVQIDNQAAAAQTIDLICVQDIGLSPYGATRVNEYYVSHYLDLSPLTHPQRGQVLAARQNLAQDSGHPWALLGSLRRGVAFATDALQFYGLSRRVGGLPPGVLKGLGQHRLQHEHGLLALQDEPLTLAAGQGAALGFFGGVQADHPAATSVQDLPQIDALLAQFAALEPTLGELGPQPATSLFSSAPLLATTELDADCLTALFGPLRRHEEFKDGALLSFTHSNASHVVLRAKELQVQRPHGHLLRSGQHLRPDETALTSTVWMGGVFHSMVTQGHVGINRFLTTTRSWLGLFSAHGLRLFVELDGESGKQWQLLGLPSAFEIEPEACRWIYRHAGGLIEVVSSASDGQYSGSGAPHSLGLQLRVLEGAPLRVLASLHIALAGDLLGDDGAAASAFTASASGVFIGVPAGSELAANYPEGGFHLAPQAGTSFDAVGGAELLFGEPHALPFVCIRSSESVNFGLRIEGRLVQGQSAPVDAALLPHLTVTDLADTPHAVAVQRLIDILPWFRHNALIHFLSPRGLEQFTGGGWGTRDVCQGPLEMLLALDKLPPVRELLTQVFSAQNADGDWPQWFMFFDAQRHIRAGDSHGDVVFWPLLGLARYLLASEDAALLNQPLPFFDGEAVTVWQHALRALAVIRQRHIEGTALVAYGHGDWNDSLQPADPQMRERMCSAWTVTLHTQVLTQLARALRLLGRVSDAEPLEAEAITVRADFQRLLVQDGVVTGYALFPEDDAPPQLLLHPADNLTGVRYSLLPMMHAVLEDMLSAEQAQSHLALIRSHLTGPDGARLFDRPLPYRGGPKQLFQRAETSAFFGREIGVMYMHAHLRYAEMLAHLGEVEAFFEALGLAHPLGLNERLPQANRRQSNCYFSSSDAAFADRYDAGRDYADINAGTVALDGGWRIYSSGPGIALGLVVGRFLGLRREKSALMLDPVMPPALCGLRALVPLAGCEVEIEYRLGAQGVGVTGLSLNGAPLTFTRGHNPYRLGAAVVAMSEIVGRLTADGANVLRVQTG